MPEVKQVYATVRNPTEGTNDPGQVTIGYYTVADGVLTMTDGDGKPVRRRYSGEPYRHKLEKGDDPIAIAKRLTLAIYLSNAGRDGLAGFSRPLNYPTIGVA